MKVVAFLIIVFFLTGCEPVIKEWTRDDIGDCIQENKSERGVVESLYSREFKGQYGMETNYYVRYRLDNGGTCTANVSRYDYKYLQRGESVSAGESRSFSEKVFGEKDAVGVIGQLFFIGGIVACVMTIWFLIENGLEKFTNKSIYKRISRYFYGVPEQNIKSISKAPFTLIAIIFTYLFVYAGLTGLGRKGPFASAAIVTLLCVILALSYAKMLGDPEKKYFNIRVISLSVIFFVLISVLFNILFGLEFSYMLKTVYSGL